MGLFVIFACDIEGTHQHLKLSEKLKNYFSRPPNNLTFHDQILALCLPLSVTPAEPGYIFGLISSVFHTWTMDPR